MKASLHTLTKSIKTEKKKRIESQLWAIGYDLSNAEEAINEVVRIGSVDNLRKTKWYKKVQKMDEYIFDLVFEKARVNAISANAPHTMKYIDKRDMTKFFGENTLPDVGMTFALKMEDGHLNVYPLIEGNFEEIYF